MQQSFLDDYKENISTTKREEKLSQEHEEMQFDLKFFRDSRGIKFYDEEVGKFPVLLFLRAKS